jgi:hypothetical protein
MREKSRICINLLVVTGFVLLLLNSCKKDNSTVLAVGDSYMGGKIAYILASSDPGYNADVQHGLIAAPTDQSTGIMWWNGSSSVTGATAIIFGTGNANTQTIVTSQGAGSYAAKLCSDLVLGGYDDWYLPSKDELFILYTNRIVIGGFASSSYWSSSEVSTGSAMLHGFSSGIQGSGGKGYLANVRAVRSF